MHALVVQEGKTVAVHECPIPTLEDNDILVKVEAIAQNPTDWKHVDFVSPPGNIIGCDFSGTVVELGKATKSGVTVGDHVAGFVQGGHYKDRGAFATFLKTDSDLVWVVPKGTMSHEQAATTGCALWTAVQALYNPSRLRLVEPPSTVSLETWVLIYGGSTSVGQFAIQLAHLSGYKVATVAGSHNHALVRSLGADAVFDYRSSDVVSQIKEATGDELHFAFDTQSTEGTQSLTVKMLGPGPGKLLLIGPPNEGAQKLRPDVEMQHTLIYTALGRSFTMGDTHHPASVEDRSHMVQFLSKLGKFVQAGNIKPNPVKLWGGGLESVKDGFQYMKEGKVSGEKIVYKL